MANGRNSNSDSQEILSWLIIIGALIVVWPVGLFLLFRKLTSQGRKRPAAQRQSVRQQPQQPGTQGIPRAQTAKTTPAGRRVPPLRGRGLIIGGACTAGVFGLALLSILGEAISSVAYGGSLSWYVEEFFVTGGFFGVGLVLLAVGLSRLKTSKRFRRYLPLIGTQTSLSLETLAKALSVPVHTVQDDLQEMLDTGILPTGYLDLSTGRLVLSTEGIHDTPKPEPQPEVSEDAEPSEADRILSEIRAVNDDIDDPVMSEKIDRIEEITRKIFAYQEKHPDKSGQLRTFLNYYLPTTLKILRAYAQMEEQGVEGSNISATKNRIEGMMDKVVEGFEKQLDQLFANTAMDITADVSVLERMLEKDGLSQKQDGITLEL